MQSLPLPPKHSSNINSTYRPSSWQGDSEQRSGFSKSIGVNSSAKTNFRQNLRPLLFFFDYSTPPFRSGEHVLTAKNRETIICFENGPLWSPIHLSFFFFFVVVKTGQLQRGKSCYFWSQLLPYSNGRWGVFNMGGCHDKDCPDRPEVDDDFVGRLLRCWEEPKTIWVC